MMIKLFSDGGGDVVMIAMVMLSVMPMLSHSQKNENIGIQLARPILLGGMLLEVHDSWGESINTHPPPDT